MCRLNFLLFGLSSALLIIAFPGSISGRPEAELSAMHKLHACESKSCAAITCPSCPGKMAPLSYAQVKEELRKPGTVLLDVRNPEELKGDGKIAESKNIPVGQMQDALKLSEAEFKKKYGFDKPKPSDHIIVHCKSGVRAQNGAQALRDAGYSDVQVYPGIMDWKSNGGPTV